MKVYFIGSLINDKSLDYIVRKSKIKPSNAPVNFENMMIKGMESNGCNVDVLSLPPISVYPGGNLILWGARKEKLNFEKEVTWIPALNLPFIKQFCVGVFTYIYLFSWLVKNRNIKYKIVMSYSVYPPYSIPIINLCRLFKCKTNCVVTDLPEYMYKMHKMNKIRSFFNNIFSNKMVGLQGKYDSYILLTKQMIEKMGLGNKPNIVIEGFSDLGIFNNIFVDKKSPNISIMYAGGLNEKYGINILIEAFMNLDGNYELWLFGSGDYESNIREYSKLDKRIRFFGRESRKFVLEKENEAHLLINIRDVKDDFTRYSFPSKTIEYMTSGTPFLTTKLQGIPDEYFKYCFTIDELNVENLTKKLHEILTLPTNVLLKKGQDAMVWVINNKNYKIQSEIIIKFLKDFI